MSKNSDESGSTPRLHRRTILQSTAIATVGLSGTGAATETDEKLSEGPQTEIVTTQSTTTTTQLEEPPTALVIRDCVIWDTTGNEDALTELGYDHEVISSSTAAEQLPNYNALSNIGVIIIPSTQDRQYYERLNSIWKTITEYVANGGILVVHAGELGWPCKVGNDVDDSMLNFLRGVNNEYTFYEVGEEVPELQELTIRSDEHPIASELSDADLSNWADDISTFGYYSGVPENATEIIGLRIDPQAYPTFIEYPYGQGRVLTTMQGPEWPFESSGSRGGTRSLLYNELEYAVELANEIEAPPEASRINGTVDVTDTDVSVDPGTAYLVDPVYESAVIDFLAGEAGLPPTIGETPIEDGAFQFDEIQSGRYLVVVDPADPFDPEYASVAAPTKETTAVSITIEPERYLSSLDSEVSRLVGAAEDVIADSTNDVSEVYVSGAQLFADDLDSEDFLPDMLSSANFALGLASGGSIPVQQEIASYIAESTVLPLAEHGHHRALAEQWRQVEGTGFKTDLESYTEACLTEDWIANLRSSESVTIARTTFSATEMYQTALGRIEDANATYEDLVLTEPADDFSIREVKTVLKTQARWLENNGLAPGVVIAPNGQGYVTRETQYHRSHYEGIETEFDVTNTLEKASTGISAAGKGLAIITSGTGVGAAVGSAASIGGWAGSMVFSMYKVYLKNQLGAAWVNSLTYWMSDLDDAPQYLSVLMNWLEQELATPTLQNVDGAIEATDLGGVEVGGVTYALANEPDYPLWWGTLPTPQWKRRGNSVITVRNTGTERAEIHLTSVDTYGDTATNGVSDTVSMYPQEFRDDPVSLAPGESTDVEFEYSSDFQPFDPFNWHHMSTTLWMQGKVVDQVQEPYYITPSFDVLPFSASEGEQLETEAALTETELLKTPIKTDNYVLTDGSKAPGEPLSVDDWTDYVGDMTRLLEQSVNPEAPTETAEYEVPADARGVVFILASPANAELNLTVEDEAGRMVGYDPDEDENAVEIPGAEYNGHEQALEIISIDESTGRYQVEATGVQFLTSEPVTASVYAVEIPERESVLAVSPTTTSAIIKPGATETTAINVSETGGQANIEVTGVSVGTFESKTGTVLSDVDVTLSERSFSVPAGERDSIDLEFVAAETIEIPDGETRFSAEATIETLQSGTAMVEVSILVFDTDVSEAQLADASQSVTGVSMTETSLPANPPESVTADRAYEIETVGSGSLSVSLPRAGLPIEQVTTYLIKDGTWSEVQQETGDRIAAELSVPTSATLVVGVGEQSVYDPYTDRNGMVSTTGLLNAFNDWQDDELETTVLLELFTAWQNEEPVV